MVRMGSFKGAASASLTQAQAWARQRGAVRLADVDAYLGEVWRLGAQLGYDPAVVAAQSSHETDGWTSPSWRERLNPAGLGISAHADKGISFPRGVDSARAHFVHLSVYLKGYEPRLRDFIHLDPTWQSVFESGNAGIAQVADDLNGRWSPEPLYGKHILDHLNWIVGAIQAPGPLPESHGGAPAPHVAQLLATGNWSERRFGQRPVAIVFHVSGDEDQSQVLSWFQNPVSRASSHAVIDREGSIHLLVDSDKGAWSNDDIKNPRRDIAWLNGAIAKHWSSGGPMSLNDFTLSIEYIGAAQSAPSEAQYRAMIELATYWRDRYYIKPNRGHLLRHSDINSVDRMYCPGPTFDLARVVEALGGSPDDFHS